MKLGIVQDSASLWGEAAKLEVLSRPGKVAVVITDADGSHHGAEFADSATINHLKRVLDEAARAAELP